MFAFPLASKHKSHRHRIIGIMLLFVYFKKISLLIVAWGKFGVSDDFGNNLSGGIFCKEAQLKKHKK